MAGEGGGSASGAGGHKGGSDIRDERLNVFDEMRAGVLKPAPVKRPHRSEQAQQLRKTVGLMTSVDERFFIDLERQLLVIADQNYTQRMVAGLLDPSGPTYGLRLYNAAGNLVFAVEDVELTGAQGISHNLVFQSTGTNTVSWAAGSLRFQNGTTYSIGAGSLNMGTNAVHYIYFDADTSTTALLTTQVATDVVGPRAYLIATARRAQGDDARAQVAPVIGSPRLASSNLTVDTVNTIHLRAGSVTATKVNIATLSEITQDAGIILNGVLRNPGNTQGIRLDSVSTLPGSWTSFLDLAAVGTAPFLKGGELELRANGDAFFSGTLQAADGTFSGSLSAAGGTFTGSLTAATGTFAGTLSAVGGTFGTITAGLLRNAGNTAGVHLGGSSIPGGWTRYLNLAATGAQPFFRFDDLEFRADGTKVWPGEVLNAPALLNASTTGTWTGTGTSFATFWAVNATAVPADYELNVYYYRNGVNIGSDTAVQVNASQPLNRTIGGGFSTEDVYVTIQLVRKDNGTVLQSLTTEELPQVI
jgi:hypothetical protein